MFKKLLIIFFSSIFALISFEIFLKYSPFEYSTSPVEYNKYIGMWHKKNFEGYIIKESYKTKYIFDQEGRPKNIFSYNKKNKDVILLGDSFIEAIMVKNKNIIHNSLAKEFENKYNFMNYGLSGSGPTQQFIILKDKVNLKNTKYIIQFIGIEGDLTDVDSKNLGSLARPKVYVEFDSLDKYKIIPPREKTLFDSVGDLLGNYQIYFFIKKSLYYLKDNVLNKKDNSLKKSIRKEKDFTKNWLYLKGAIHQINEYIKKSDKNIKYKIIITSKNRENKLILKKFLDSENIKFMFLNDTVKKMGIELKSFKCDGHWNDYTHKSIARLIKDTNFID